MNIRSAEAFVKEYSAHEKLADVYDDDKTLSTALSVLFPDFEYPDFSYLTVGEIWKRYSRNPISSLP